MKKKPYSEGGNGFDSRLGHQETPVKSGVSINDLKSRAKSRAGMEQAKPYTAARLYHGNHKEWYVEFSYQKPDGSGMKRFKHRFDIGRIRRRFGDDAAIVYGNECAAILNKELAAGLNPFKQLIKRSTATAWETLQQLVHSLSGNASQYSINTYNEHLNRLQKFMPEVQQPGFTISDFSRTHANKYINALQKAGLASKTINGSISYFKLFWKYLQRDGKVIDNVFDGIDRLKKREASTRYEPFTAAEVKQIFEHLAVIKQQQLLCFCQFIFYAWARPAEIRRLRVGDIDLDKNLIRFPASSTKNKKGAFVQILPQLAESLKKMQLHKYPAQHYLFGKWKMHPGTEPLNDDSLHERWLLHIQKKLGISKTMYALKHTGNIMYIQNNAGKLDLKWQQMQNRHSSPAMTEKYIRELGVYFIDTSDVYF